MTHDKTDKLKSKIDVLPSKDTNELKVMFAIVDNYII